MLISVLGRNFNLKSAHSALTEIKFVAVRQKIYNHCTLLKKSNSISKAAQVDVIESCVTVRSISRL